MTSHLKYKISVVPFLGALLRSGVALASLRSVGTAVGLLRRPVVFGVLVPVVQFLLDGHALANDAGFLAAFAAVMHVLAQFDVQVLAGDGLVVFRAALALEHALVVPAAEQDGSDGTDYVGQNIEGVEYTVILQGMLMLYCVSRRRASTYGEQALDDFGADAECQCADKQGHLDDAAAVRFHNPVEG